MSRNRWILLLGVLAAIALLIAAVTSGSLLLWVALVLEVALVTWLLRPRGLRSG